MQQHVRILGWLHIIFGAIGLLIGIFVFLIMGGVAGVIGLAADSGDAVVAAPIVAIVGTVVLGIAAALSLPGLIAGIGLLNGQAWARALMIVLSVIHLFNFPFGTALGVYGLWVLLSPEMQTAPRRTPSY